MPTVKVNITGDASNLKQATGQAQTALSGLDRAGASLKSGMMSAGIAIAGVTAAVAAGKKVYEQTVGAVIDYNKAILDASRATRMGVEDMSRFVQVGDDMGVGMDAITRSLQLATKNGFAPSIDALADLADKANAMASPTDRAAMLAKIMGRNWAELDPILQLGGQRIRELAAAQADGLVATENEIQTTEELRLSLDELSDAWTALKMDVGLAIAVPVVAAMHESAAATDHWTQAVQTLRNSGVVPTQQAIQGMFRKIEDLSALEDIAAIKDALDTIPRNIDVSVSVGANYLAAGAQASLVYGAGGNPYIPRNAEAVRASQAAFSTGKAGRGEGAFGSAIGGLATPGLHMVGEEGPELISTDNRGNINVLRASVTRALSKGTAMMAHALDQGGGGGGSVLAPKPKWLVNKDISTSPGYSKSVFSSGGGGGSSAAAETQATAAQAVAEAAASAIPQAVAQGTRIQQEAMTRIASDNAKASAANARMLGQIRDILLMQGTATDIGNKVAGAMQTVDLGY